MEFFILEELMGFVSFDPLSIKIDSTSLPATITSFKVYGKELRLPKIT